MFNDRLRATRIFRNVTQQKTADAMGVSLRHYQKYESGEVEPDFMGLVELSDFFNVPADFLLGRDDYLKSLGVSVDVSLECPPRRPRHQKNRQSLHTQSSGNDED
ncbi:helix-turn-helix domain-containing protein [Lachnospiraceae bacterium ASD4241]|uniref:Helix-turn-helix domain-containing protein n=1 Tax=Diplocloster modestus TaxID=2850322 RepID=A0ABS6KC22_9FIRM|nr:helix-turn-helix domain-containing protein [Diplocloster modestus]